MNWIVITMQIVCLLAEIYCLTVLLTFLGFALYLFPYLLWGLNYDVPPFIVSWQVWLEMEYNLSMTWSKWVLLCCFIAVTILVSFLAFWVSQASETRLVKALTPKIYSNQYEKIKYPWVPLLLKVILLTGIVLLALYFYSVVVHCESSSCRLKHPSLAETSKIKEFPV